MTTTRVWMGLGTPPRSLTRQQYRALALEWAGEQWDAWAAEDKPHMRSEAEVMADRGEALARAHQRYLATPEWTEADAAAALADILAGRDPRRIRAAYLAARSERA